MPIPSNDDVIVHRYPERVAISRGPTSVLIHTITARIRCYAGWHPESVGVDPGGENLAGGEVLKVEADLSGELLGVQE